MQTTRIADLVRRYFAAYEAHDRSAIEGLLAEDFSFTSPYDDHLDRATYFEHCWPNSAHKRAMHVMKLFSHSDEALIVYEGRLENGQLCRNAELFRIRADKIAAIEVYFGAPASLNAGATKPAAA
jgi:ketosteroid isomerase-like protein